MSRLFHPFSNPIDVDAAGELVLESGEGATVTDTDGREYLDLAGSLWYCNVGHGRAELATAASEQMGRIESYSTFGDTCTRPAVDLSERIADLAPVDDPKVFFTSGGSDAVDTAIKMVIAVAHLRGEPERDVIVHRRHAYHGMHLGGTAISGIPANRVNTESELHTRQVEWDDPADLERTIEEAGGRVIAFFCEPVIGAGGVHAASPEYLRRVADICARHDVLLVLDEVITGFGRLGGWFASDRFGIRPDLLLFAKGVTSGYQPLGGVVVSSGVWRTLGDVEGPWRHGYTYSAHATACAVGLANMDLLEKDHLFDAAARLESEIGSAFGPLSGLTGVTEVRSGVGALAAVQLDPAHLSAADAARRLRQHGVLTRAIGGDSLQVSPPLCITTEQVRRAADAIGTVLSSPGSD